MDMRAADDVKQHLGQLGSIGQTKTRCWLLPMQATPGALQGKRGGSKNEEKARVEAVHARICKPSGI